ncbi:MAG: BrnT family toxin [Candidatus Contendobacter sp.]|nr:BrnT family toxin [Candidatus Contendobacter sp.]
MISYDETKRQTNLVKHGIDLAECESVFDAPLSTDEDDREAYGEQRLRTLGLWNGIVVVIIHTPRDRLISIRKADRHEQRKYWKHHPA